MSRPRGWLVTGTDTGIGKTAVTLGLMRVLQRTGLQVLGMKPVASGAEPTGSGLRNADALALAAAGSRPVDYGLVNPYAFAPPIAPHLAARQAGQQVQIEPLLAAFEQLAGRADRVLVEGVGGWRVPLSDELELADLARALDLPVVLVVGLRLGCLNQALLSADAVLDAGLTLAGWVANIIDPDMQVPDDNIASLRRRIDAPLLGVVPRLEGVDGDAVATHLDQALEWLL